MASAAEQLEAQEKIGEALKRQMEGQLAEPPSTASSAAGGAADGAGAGHPGTDSDVQSDSDEDPNEDPEARKARKKLRRACDYCTRKKVRCDGSRPCRQCQKKQVECKFSICQRSGPRSIQQADYAAPGSAAAASAMVAAAAAATAAGAAVGGAGSPPSSQMTTALSGGGITSKVDVTYLNFFLKEFNAFVPLATQEVLRDALNPTPSALSNRNPGGDEEYRRQNARVAVIQGCISIGAMIKGQAQIVKYMRNVREALSHCFDFVSPETMTAYMVVAYCHDLMGNAAATRNYMEFAKAVATQLPLVTVEHELVFQFYRVCSEVHNCTLSATPKLLQQMGSAAAPCYQVLNVLTYALYDLAHLATEELVNAISREQVTAELHSLHPILARADSMSRDNASSFGALGMVLVKGVLAYVLLRLGKSQEGLEVLEPVVVMLTDNPGLLRQVMCWHLSHCMLAIFLEHGWFKEFETMRLLYNGLLQPERGAQHFPVWGRGHYQDATPFPPVDRLHGHGNSFLCSNPLCKAINRDLSDGVDVGASGQGSHGGLHVGEANSSAAVDPARFASGAGSGDMPGAQSVINMVAGGGFLNFDAEAGVNVAGLSTSTTTLNNNNSSAGRQQLPSTPPPSLPGCGGGSPNQPVRNPLDSATTPSESRPMTDSEMTDSVTSGSGGATALSERRTASPGSTMSNKSPVSSNNNVTGRAGIQTIAPVAEGIGREQQVGENGGGGKSVGLSGPTTIKVWKRG